MPYLESKTFFTQVSGVTLRGAASNMNVSLAWYNASDGADGAIASGAYIFRRGAAHDICVWRRSKRHSLRLHLQPVLL